MGKQKKQTYILIGLLCLAILFWFAANRYSKSRQEEETKAEEEKQAQLEIFTTSASGISRITYDYDGQTVDIVELGDKWVNRENPNQKILDSAIENMKNSLSAIDAITIIDNVTDLDQYGLNTGYRKITFEYGEDQSFTYYIGDKNDLTGNYYMMLPDKTSTVYAVSNVYITYFNKTVEDMIDNSAEESEESKEEAALDVNDILDEIDTLEASESTEE